MTGEFDADDPDVAARPRARRAAADHVRVRHRGAAAAAGARARAVHGDVVRQPRGQRPRSRATVFTAFARLRDAELGDWIEREVRLPELDGRPHHAGDHRRRPRRGRASASVSRTSGRWSASRSRSGCSRTRFSRRPAAARGRRRAARRRRRALRADEAAAAQRQPPGARATSATCAGYRLRARGRAGPAVRRLPARLHGRGGDADARAGARARPRRLQAHADRALLQPAGARHDRRGCAPRARTGSPSGSCRSSAHQLEPGGEITRSAAIVASWARYAEGIDEQGAPIEVVDRLRGHASSQTRAPPARRTPTRSSPTATLFGDLVDDERFVAAYRSALASLHARGARATLAALNA